MTKEDDNTCTDKWWNSTKSEEDLDCCDKISK